MSGKKPNAALASGDAQDIFGPPMNMKEIAAIFKKSESTMRRWLKGKEIKAKRVGSNWRIALEELPLAETDQQSAG